MYPVICQIGPATIYSYGLMLAIAVLVCTYFLSRDAGKQGIASEVIMDLVFWLVLSGLLGSRLIYVLLNFPFYLRHPVEIIMVQSGGLAFQGGLICGGLSFLWFVKKRKLNLKFFLDLIIPYLALGHAIGRIGCFLNGCCYGYKSEVGLYFPVHQDVLIPTQLYASFGLLIIFFILKKYQSISKVEGSVFVLYLGLASLLRFTIEFYRADHSVKFLGLSIFQFMCLGFFIIAGLIYARLKS